MTRDTDETHGSDRRIGTSASRRGFLATAAAGAIVGAGGLAYAQQDNYAYRLGGDTAGWVGRAPSSIENATNPTLTFQAGQEYTIWWENVDGQPHNIAILDSNGNVLQGTEIITEQGATQTMTFTATEEMAEYYCEVHPNSMRGQVQIETGGGTQTPQNQTETEQPQTETEQPETEQPETEQPETEQPETEQPQQPTASVTFDNQTTTGVTVTVQKVTMSEGGFVTIHDANLLQQGEAFQSVIGVSKHLEAGEHTNVCAALFQGVPGRQFDQSKLMENRTLIAMPHLDTNGNGTYDFVTSNGSADGPYTSGGGAVVDEADVSVR